MAKTIKFNLICDGKPVRTLEDLRNNFSIEDVLLYYNNKLLHRWLTVRGYTEELEKVEAIKEYDDLARIKKLIDIFAVETDDDAVKMDTQIFAYKKEREIQAYEYERRSFKANFIITKHHEGYQQLVDTIIKNKHDIAQIKAAVKEIDEEYHDLFELDFRTLFNVLISHAPMAIFVMLMRENMWNKYLHYATSKSSSGSNNSDGDDMFTMSDLIMYDKICDLTASYSTLKEILGDNLHEFAGKTDQYWQDIEPKGRRYMILKMDAGNLIRSAGNAGEKLDAQAINKNFIILDGIDYMSNNENLKLLYMEV